MPGYVFISYSKHDRPYVEKLAEYLREAGIDVWYDYELAAGTRFDKMLAEKVTNCEALVVVVTPAAFDSDWVANELSQAREVGKPILPLLLEGQLFFGLKHAHYENVVGGVLPSAGFVDLLRSRLGLTTAVESTDRPPAGARAPGHPAQGLDRTPAGTSPIWASAGPTRADAVGRTPARKVGAHAPAKASVQIALAGPAAAGKTTYIASIALATLRTQGWRLVGDDDESDQYLLHLTDQLSVARRFPEATVSAERLTFSLRGQLDPGWVARFLRRPGNSVEVRCSVIDSPGESFARADADLVGSLLNADGLLYLFDPVRALRGDHSDGTVRLLAEVAGEAERRGIVDRDGRLSHHINVCITKFDDPMFFGLLLAEGWIDPASLASGVPAVPRERGAELFRRLVDRRAAAALTGLFAPDRIQYHLVSAVGFGLDAAGRVDVGHPSNVMIVNGVPALRSALRPVNVLESLVSLGERVARSRRR